LGSGNVKGKYQKKPMGVMDIVLIIVGVLLVVFTATMIYLYTQFQSIPNTLCTCVFSCLGGECGIMGWIKTSKEKTKQREWEKANGVSPDKKQEDMIYG